MVGMYGIGGVPAPAIVKEVTGNAKGVARDTAVAVGDKVKISEEAHQAADISRLVEKSELQSEIRTDAIEQAKENLEQGTYKVLDVVKIVASRIGAYIDVA